MSVKLAALALSLLGTTSVAAADARRAVAANGETSLEFLAAPAESGADLSSAIYPVSIETNPRSSNRHHEEK